MYSRITILSFQDLKKMFADGMKELNDVVWVLTSYPPNHNLLLCEY